MISPKKVEDVILSAENVAEFIRSVEDLFDYKYGIPGQNICNGVKTGMKQLPTQDDTDKAGRRVYKALPEDPAQLTEQAFSSFQEDRKRAIRTNDKYKEDDIACVSYLMQHLDMSVTTNLRNSPEYKAYKAMEEGDRSYKLFQAIKKIVSTPDVNSMVNRACDYLGTKFTGDINQTMDMINVRAAQFSEDFKTSRHQEVVSFDIIKSVVIYGVLSNPAFQMFKQVHSANTLDPLGNSDELMQAALTYASANREYVNSFPGTDLQSERGQAYHAAAYQAAGPQVPAPSQTPRPSFVDGYNQFAQQAFYGSPLPPSAFVANQRSYDAISQEEFLKTSQGQAYAADLKKPGGSLFPVQHSASFQPPAGKFAVVGPRITDTKRFCHDCYIRTGRCYTNHGNPGQPECSYPSLERNPEATAIKSYIAELLIDPHSEATVSALQMLDEIVTKCD
jgi:hypothetical protein